MNKKLIKIVKPEKKVGSQKTQIIINPTKIEKINQAKMVTTVSNWISERQDSRRIERAFSESNILAWKILSSPLTKG